MALANLKCLPLVWHVRFIRAFAYQLYLQPTPMSPNTLFQPLISSSRTSLMELDFNLHKSNSTYFSDMDISRTHLFTAIIRNAIRKSPSQGVAGSSGVAWLGATKGTKGNHTIALGAISCHFRREIPFSRKYEMWTRLLCWDRKWFYLVTHIVKPGLAKPRKWSLQPWRRVNTARGEEVSAEKLKGAVYATAIAKYVVKEGRVTVPAEQVLIDADMVPIKPEGWVYKGGDDNLLDDVEGMLALPSNGIQSQEWDWDTIERERRRGLKFAEAFAELDGMHDLFNGGKEGALREYPDLLWR